MMTPRDIYEQYRIMPNLQLHQLRVAAVGKYICDRFIGPIDTQMVVLACLVHDMGNILKSDFSIGKELLAEKGIPYWESVKADYVKKYSDEHHATHVIIKEVGIDERIASIIEDMGFSKMETVVATGSNELLVLEYADMRVGPDGILSLDGRLSEGHTRYSQRMKGAQFGFSQPERYEILVSACHEMEKKLVSRADFQPEDITDASLSSIVEELWDYVI